MGEGETIRCQTNFCKKKHQGQLLPNTAIQELGPYWPIRSLGRKTLALRPGKTPTRGLDVEWKPWNPGPTSGLLCEFVQQRCQKSQKNTDSFHLESINSLFQKGKNAHPHLCTTCDIVSVWHFCPWGCMLYRGRCERRRRHHHVAKCFPSYQRRSYTLRSRRNIYRQILI